MKHFLLLSFVALFICSVHAQKAPEGLFIASKAPDFKAKDQNGTEIRLKDLLKKGKVVLVFYRGNWCPYCNKELSRLQGFSVQSRVREAIALKEKAYHDLESTRRNITLQARQQFLNVTNGIAQINALKQAYKSSQTQLCQQCRKCTGPARNWPHCQDWKHRRPRFFHQVGLKLFALYHYLSQDL